MGLSSVFRSRRRTTVAVGIAVAVAAGATVYATAYRDTGDKAVNVAFVLGGGTARQDTAAQGGELAIAGEFRGLAAGSDDTLYLFTQEDDGMVMWQRQKSGATKRIRISGMDDQTAEQAAVAPDGSVYLATGALWRVGPDGKAVQLIDPDCDSFSPSDAPLAKFCTSQVTGVTVAEDGTVYFGDEIVQGGRSSFVHRLRDNRVELVAGRQPKQGEALDRSNPSVRDGIDPPAGTPAKNVLVPAVWDAGWLASDAKGLYWRTGAGIVRLLPNGTLSPLLAARAPEKISAPKGPLEAMGRALDTAISPAKGTKRRGDLAATLPGSEVFYSDAGKAYSPPFSEEYRWGGNESPSQEKFLQNLVAGKAVYRVAAGEVSPVLLGAQAIAASGTTLYVAAESKAGTADDWSCAVVKVQLPESKN
ncbi:hypothetical protein AB0907_22530 [Streptomyces sp. NPDC006975]|uniref:hypothetical protein n=1 Tax=unclassified Streptomyces TaxID=2593676 RepID=UPI0034555DC3